MPTSVLVYGKPLLSFNALIKYKIKKFKKKLTDGQVKVWVNDVQYRVEYSIEVLDVVVIVVLMYCIAKCNNTRNKNKSDCPKKYNICNKLLTNDFVKCCSATTHPMYSHTFRPHPGWWYQMSPPFAKVFFIYFCSEIINIKIVYILLFFFFKFEVE